MGRPPPLGGLGGVEEGPGEGWWWRGVCVTVGVGVPDGDGEHWQLGGGDVGHPEPHPGGGDVGHPEPHPGGGDVGHPEPHPGGGDVGFGVGDGVVHATQNTFCLARPFSPVKFHSSL